MSNRPVISESRRKFLKQTGAGALALGLSPQLGQAMGIAPDWGKRKRPNVVLIVSDDHRTDLMSCAGNPYMKTPHFDRLAAEGIRFENGFSTAGVCSPSRGSIMTGKYSHRSATPHICWMNNSFHRQETPFPAQMQQAGYYTAHVGKWHLGAGQKAKPGYDTWRSFEFLGEYFDTTLWIDNEPHKFEGFSDDIIAEQAAGIIRDRADEEQPFCMVVGLKAPHLNFSYPPRHEHTFDGIDIPKPDNYDEDYDVSGREMMKQTGIKIEEFAGGLPMFGNDWKTYIKSYYRSSQAIDDAVGVILDALDENNIADDTIVIYTSDQGYSLGDHGLTEKHYAYEHSMRVPMMIRYPRVIKPEQVRSEMVLNIDIAPTIMDLCGLEAPAGADGTSWRPLLKQSRWHKPKWREDFLFELASPAAVLPAQLAVRTDEYKFITYPHAPEYPELYDLVKDPEEDMNVVNDPAYAEVRKDMQARLDRLVAESDWQPRGAMSIPKISVLGPVAPSDCEAVRKQLAAAGSDWPQPPVKAGEQTLSWQTLEVGPNNQYNIAAAMEGAGGEDKVFISFHVERLMDRDPYTALSCAPQRPFRAYNNGELIQEITLGNPWAVGYNPPLAEQFNTVTLEMNATQPPVISFGLDTIPSGIKLH